MTGYPAATESPMGPAASTQGPLVLRVQLTESGHHSRSGDAQQRHLTAFLQAPASLLLRDCRLGRLTAHRSARQERLGMPLASPLLGPFGRRKRLCCEVPARIRTEKVPSRGSADDRHFPRITPV